MDSIFTINCILCGKEVGTDKWHRRRKFCSEYCGKISWYKCNMVSIKDRTKKYYSLNSEKIKERTKIWNIENHERRKARDRNYYYKNKGDLRIKRRNWHVKNSFKVRSQVMAHYANGLPICNCCGEANIYFLTLDHVNNNGNIFRKENPKLVGLTFYKWLIKNNFPNLGLQVLCYNCNCAKGYAGYKICPHKVIKK